MKTPRHQEEYFAGLVQRGVLEVDGEGRIWRLMQPRGGAFKPIARRRCEWRLRTGYLALKVEVDGKTVTALAHRLVYRVTKGPIPAGLCINHIDGRKDNNHPSNLEAVTESENLAHAFRTGLRRQDGERSKSARFKDAEVRAIREEYAKGGVKQVALCARLGLTQAHLSAILRGQKYPRSGGPLLAGDARHSSGSLYRCDGVAAEAA